MEAAGCLFDANCSRSAEAVLKVAGPSVAQGRYCLPLLWDQSARLMAIDLSIGGVRTSSETAPGHQSYPRRSLSIDDNEASDQAKGFWLAKLPESPTPMEPPAVRSATFPKQVSFGVE